MPVVARPAHERAIGKFVTPDGPEGCWTWMASRAHGYGRIGVAVSPGRSVPAQAHRVMYEALIGPIPDGLHLDHLCQNRACVNPAHLQPVTNAENARRARLLRTTCRAGHEQPERDRWGDCVLCRVARERRRVRRGATSLNRSTP